MRRHLVAFVLTSAFFLPAVALAYASPGSPTGHVNDFAHVLSTDTTRTLESELAAFQASTTNEIAVAIVPSMDGDYVENYAVKLFEEWGVGKKTQDNGVLLLLSIEEHKMRIEVGYGLEGALPDSLAQRILDDDMTPLLKDGDYDGAVTSGVHSIESAIQGEYVNSSSPDISGTVSWLFDNFWYIFVGIFLALQWLASILARSKSWWAGGVVGLIGGLGLGWFFAPAFLLLIAGGMAAFGLIFDYLVSNAFHGAKMSGALPPWWAGGTTIGGSHSGGSSFGGFGGGSSGGGGASGGW